MDDVDEMLAERIMNIVAVAVDDIDAVNVSVENRIAYLEGVVPDEDQRKAIVQGVRNVDGLARSIICLANEHVLPRFARADLLVLVSLPVLLHAILR